MFETLIWIVPLIITVAGWRQPRAGLLVLAASLPLFASPPGGPYLAALDVAALAAIVTGLRGESRRRSTLDAGVLAFVAVAVAALFPLAYRPPSWSPGVLAELLRFLPEVEPWSILSTWRAIADLLLGTGLYLAIKRAFSRGSIDWLGRAFGIGLLGALALGFAELGGWIDLWSYRPIGRTYFEGRFHSLFFHSGWLAEFVVLATPIAVAAWGADSLRRRIVGLSLLVLGGGAILLSGQRGAWFAVMVQLAVALLLLRRTWREGRVGRKLVAASGSLVVIGALVAGVIVSRPEVGSDLKNRLGEAAANLSNRTIIWQATLEMASKRPLLGWGSGSFSPVFDLEIMVDENIPQLGLPILGHHHNWLTAHNTYLMLLAERGAMGVVSLALLGILLAFVLWDAARGESPRLAIGLTVTAAGFAVYGLVQYMFFPRANGFLVWMILGLAALVDQGMERPALARAARGFAVVALLLLPLRAVFGHPAPARSSQEFGFHAPELGQGEVPYQWTASKRAVQRVRWENEVLRVEVANGHPKASEKPVFVEVVVDGAVVDQVTADGGWEELSIYLGPPTKKTVLLELVVDRTFRPFSEYAKYPDLGRSRDLRRLGVAVQKFRWEKAPATIELEWPKDE